MRHVLVSFDRSRLGSGFGAEAWIVWARNREGSFEKLSHGGKVLKDSTAMVAEREALRLGIQRQVECFPTEVGEFDFALENSGKTVQYKIDVVSLRLRNNKAG